MKIERFQFRPFLLFISLIDRNEPSPLFTIHPQLSAHFAAAPRVWRRGFEKFPTGRISLEIAPGDSSRPAFDQPFGLFPFVLSLSLVSGLSKFTKLNFTNRFAMANGITTPLPWSSPKFSSMLTGAQWWPARTIQRSLTTGRFIIAMDLIQL